MTKTITPFEVIQELSSSREYNYTPEIETAYAPFLTNRGFSNFYDTIMIANEMNTMAVSKVPKKWQFDFYHFVISPKKKRFAAWAKSSPSADIITVSDYYKCSKQIAEQYLKVLTQEDIKELEAKMFKGGR
jgi:hypothetical protein